MRVVADADDRRAGDADAEQPVELELAERADRAEVHAEAGAGSVGQDPPGSVEKVGTTRSAANSRPPYFATEPSSPIVAVLTLADAHARTWFRMPDAAAV